MIQTNTFGSLTGHIFLMWPVFVCLLLVSCSPRGTAEELGYQHGLQVCVCGKELILATEKLKNHGDVRRELVLEKALDELREYQHCHTKSEERHQAALPNDKKAIRKFQAARTATIERYCPDLMGW